MRRLGFLALLLSAPSACGGGGGSGGAGACDFTNVAAYVGSDYETNAATALALRGQLSALEDRLAEAEADLAVVPTVAELDALYASGTPSLQSETDAAFDPVALGILADFAAAAGNAWTPADPPAGPGGKFGPDAIFTADGILLRERIEKGLYLGTFVARASALASSGVDAAGLDEILALYGAHPDFPGDSETTDPLVVAHPDDLVAKYAERRTRKDPQDSSLPLDPAAPGLYFGIKADFVTAKEALAAGTCQEEADAAIAGVFEKIERVAAATAIYYLNRASLLATGPAPTVDMQAEAMGAYSEAASFLEGLRLVDSASRTITDAELDALLALVGATPGSTAAGYLLAVDPTALVPALTEAMSDLAGIYGFDVVEVEQFKLAF